MSNFSYIGAGPAVEDTSGVPDVAGENNKELSVVNGASKWSPIRLNPLSLDVSTTIYAGSAGTVGGPFLISDGVILTVEDGATFVVV